MPTTATRKTYDQIKAFSLFSDAKFNLSARVGTLQETGLLKALIDQIDSKISLEELLEQLVDHWVGVDSASDTTFAPQFGSIYSVNTTAAQVEITLPTEPPTMSTEISFFDPVNTWGTPNKLIVNAPAGMTVPDGIETSFEMNVPGDGKLIKFARPELLGSPGTYDTNWVVQSSSNSSGGIITQDSTTEPSATQYQIWLQPDLIKVEFAINGAWYLFPGF